MYLTPVGFVSHSCHKLEFYATKYSSLTLRNFGNFMRLCASVVAKSTQRAVVAGFAHPDDAYRRFAFCHPIRPILSATFRLILQFGRLWLMSVAFFDRAFCSY